MRYLNYIFLLCVLLSCEPVVQDDGIKIDAAIALDPLETANCYIVSDAGTYSFETVKGNCREHVGQVASAEVLWETFGYSLRPQKGDLVRDVIYESDRVYFRTAEPFKEGNAVIAVRDADGSILWSWHIWMTDEPQAQEYPANAGVMMDRNLGATSTGPGHVLSLGLLYQWGRKDPFLNCMHIDKPILAQSTLSWPSPVICDEEVGTIDFSIKNPTTFIYRNIKGSGDWHYVKDHTRWQSNKTKYDPCPAGWRVPDGGENNIWDKAGFTDEVPYDDVKMGTSLELGNSVTAWYPYAGYRYCLEAFNTVSNLGEGFYWSCTGSGDLAFNVRLFIDRINTHDMSGQAYGYSVRCQRD